MGWVCMAAPLQGLVKPGCCPLLFSGGLSKPRAQFWETQKWAGCAFSHHNILLTFHSKRAQSCGWVPSPGEGDLSVL